MRAQRETGRGEFGEWLANKIIEGLIGNSRLIEGARRVWPSKTFDELRPSPFQASSRVVDLACMIKVDAFPSSLEALPS